MANPNIVNVTTINGRSNVAIVTTTANTILTNPASSNKIFKVNTLIVTNTGGSVSAAANVTYYDSSLAQSILLTREIEVPVDDTVIVLDKNSSLYLEEGDYIQVSANTAANSTSGAAAVVSFEEIS
jgi:hypothetical protein